MKKIICLLSLFAGIASQAQTVTYLNTDFTEGIPVNFTVKDYDKNPVVSSDFLPDKVNDSWNSASLDQHREGSGWGAINIVAVSTSRGENDTPVNNWLITPAMQIDSEDAVLMWDAQSVHGDFLDGYKVMVSTTDIQQKSFTEVFSIEEEGYFWTKRFLSLKAYKGKNIYIAFVHNSQNKYILALDNIFVGVPEPGNFNAKEETKRFVGDIGTSTVKGKMQNIAGKVKLQRIDCVIQGGETLEQTFDNLELQPGDEAEFEFTVPVSVGNKTVYTLNVTTDAFADKVVQKDSIICSHYPLRLLAEEFTGVWCNTCPLGSLYINRLKERYKNDDLINVIGHCGQDPFVNKYYDAGLRRWIFNLPSFVYNRNSSYVFGPQPDYRFEDTKLAQFITLPVYAQIDLTAEFVDKEHRELKTHVEISFAKEYDNSNDNFRIGYAIVEKSVGGVKQSNSVNLARGKEFAFLPQEIPGYLMVHHNIGRGTENAFTGIEKSLPNESLQIGDSIYSYDHTIKITDISTNDRVKNRGNISVVAFIINTRGGSVLAACEVRNPIAHPDFEEESIIEEEQAKAVNDFITYVSEDRQSIIVEPSAATDGEQILVNLVGVDGNTVFSTSVEGGRSLSIPTNGRKGYYIVTMKVKGENTSKKIVLN